MKMQKLAYHLKSLTNVCDFFDKLESHALNKRKTLTLTWNQWWMNLNNYGTKFGYLMQFLKPNSS